MKLKLLSIALLIFFTSCTNTSNNCNQKMVWNLKDGVAVDEKGRKLENVVVLSEESPAYIIESYNELVVQHLESQNRGNEAAILKKKTSELMKLKR